MTTYEKQIKKNKSKYVYGWVYTNFTILIIIALLIQIFILNHKLNDLIAYFLVIIFGTGMSILEFYFYYIIKKDLIKMKDTFDKLDTL